MEIGWPYLSDETGRLEAYARPFTSVGEGKWLISDNGAVSVVRWSTDGSELFSVSQGQMVSIGVSEDRGALEPGTPEPLFEAPSGTFGFLFFDVSPADGRFLILKQDTGEETQRMVIVENLFYELERPLPTQH